MKSFEVTLGPKYKLILAAKSQAELAEVLRRKYRLRLSDLTGKVVAFKPEVLEIQ